MRYIKIKTNFEAFHRYKNAPNAVDFLRDWHRHIFNVELTFNVVEANREREFFMTKQLIDKYIARNYKGKRFEMSCEMIAEDLVNEFNCSEVFVDEDGENGGGFIKI